LKNLAWQPVTAVVLWLPVINVVDVVSELQSELAIKAHIDVFKVRAVSTRVD